MEAGQVLATAVVIGLAAGPTGAALQEAWRQHPVLFKYSGAFLLLGLAVLAVIWRLVGMAFGVRPLMTSKFLQATSVVVSPVVRVLVGRGELAVLLVGVFQPDAVLLPAATTLAAGQAILLGSRLRPSRIFTDAQARDVFVIARMSADLRHRELSRWVYDRFISGRPDDRLPQAIVRMGLGMAPDVTRIPAEKKFLDRQKFHLEQSGVLLGVADEVIDIIEQEAQPRLMEPDRAHIAGRLSITRAIADELRARLSYANGDWEQGDAQLRTGAELLSRAGLPNLAAFQRVLAAYAQVRADTPPDEVEALPDDVLAEVTAIAASEVLSWAVRRLALRLEAAQRYRRGEENRSRFCWLAARYAGVSRAEYRTVAGEVGTEMGIRRWQYISRSATRNRLREQPLLARSEDMLVSPLMVRSYIATFQALSSSRRRSYGARGGG
jgi:hypothetical protein